MKEVVDSNLVITMEHGIPTVDCSLGTDHWVDEKGKLGWSKRTSKLSC